MGELRIFSGYDFANSGFIAHLLLADLSVWQIQSQLFIVASCEPAKLGGISAARSSFETASLLLFDMALQNLRKSPVSAGSACRF